MSVSAVIFDIGNVLVEWHPTRPFDRLLGRARREALFADVDFAGMNERVDLGADFETEVAALADRHPDRRDEVTIWRDHWMEMLAPDLPRSAALLRALRTKGVAVHALSNFGTATLAMAEPRYPVLTEFDRRFVSGHLGLIKPDPAIYAHVEEALGLDPATLFFIDDRPENIAAAEARGWQGHLFTTPEALEARLVAAGLLDRGEVAA